MVRVEFIIDDNNGIALFASDRATLLRAAPELASVIGHEIETCERGPVWLACLFEDATIAADADNIREMGAPPWWVQLHAARRLHRGG